MSSQPGELRLIRFSSSSIRQKLPRKTRIQLATQAFKNAEHGYDYRACANYYGISPAALKDSMARLSKTEGKLPEMALLTLETPSHLSTNIRNRRSLTLQEQQPYRSIAEQNEVKSRELEKSKCQLRQLQEEHEE